MTSFPAAWPKVRNVTVIAAAAAIALLPISTALSSVGTPPPNTKNIIAITHAAGRMGKLLALQLREDAVLSGTPPEALPTIRAIVRSRAEARSVECDLGGMAVVGGRASPIPLDWLETVIVEDIGVEEGRATLRDAFEGAGSAVLCDASHNEMVWSDGDDGDRVNGGGNGEGVCSISVPAAENKDLSARLLAEIEAASFSSTLRHVVLRSSMGLSSKSTDEAKIAMGGEAALAGPRGAEEALRSSKIDHTVLRLGALTDDGGMVPLIFGVEDSILLKRMDGTDTRRPPILSRSDAARASIFLLREAASFKGATIDCSWHPKYGRSSVGSEEAFNAAGRQNLKWAVSEGCRFSVPLDGRT